MNKFLCIALALCVAVASASPVPEIDDEASQLALWETDEVETRGLGEEKAIFNDFCLAARDEVKAYMKNAVNSNAARVFNLMVETAGQIGEAIAASEQKAAADGSAKLEGDAREVKSAFGGLISALTGTAKEKVKEVYAKFREELNTENLTDAANAACVDIGMSLKPSIDKKLSAYKKEILATPEGAQYKDLFAKTRVDNLGCSTTFRLSKVATVCNLVRTLAPTMAEFFKN